MSDAPYQWVTVARFFAPGEALFFKSVLEGNDIPAFVRNEYTGQLHIGLTHVVGGILLQVPSDCVEMAKALLEMPPDVDETWEDEAEAEPESPDDAEVSE